VTSNETFSFSLCPISPYFKIHKELVYVLTIVISEDLWIMWGRCCVVSSEIIDDLTTKKTIENGTCVRI